MRGKHQIKRNWKDHIDSFPQDTPMLQILSSCMQQFPDDHLPFSEWAAIIKEYLSSPKKQGMASVAVKESKATGSDSTQANIEKAIISFIKKNSGVKASEVSSHIGYDKRQINSILHKLQRDNICRQDSEYRWSISSNNEQPENSGDEERLLDKYESLFRCLNVSKKGEKRAPHKYILLISVAHLIEKGKICSNRIESSLDLEKEFHSTWERYVPKDTDYKCAHTYPFWHMMSEPFWRLYLNPGILITRKWEDSITSPIRQRREIYAEIDDELASLFRNDIYRRHLISVLIEIINDHC